MKQSERHSRTVLLLGEVNFEKLRQAHVLVVGLGGVGGYAAEQLCRAGIGELTLVDADTVQESNLNRQIIALDSTIGKDKTAVLTERLKDINPDVKIHSLKTFLNGEKAEALLSPGSYDHVVDAIDTLAPKVNLIKTCLKYNIPLVSSMGAGGRTDPEKVHITDIGKTFNCGLARMLRKRLHKSGIRTGFKAVFSSEKTSSEAVILEKSQNKKTNVGTISYMPGIFGMFCASVVIRAFTEN
jgi:tRNA A37 threonylcarbamoyladenosine dehydratase